MKQYIINALCLIDVHLWEQSLLGKGRVPKRSPKLYKVMPVRICWQKWLFFVHFVFNMGISSAHFILFSQSSQKLLLLALQGTNRALSSPTF